MSKIITIVKHDLALEFSRPSSSISVLLFGFGAVISAHLAFLYDGSRATDQIVVGVIWIVLMFAAILGSSWALHNELERGCFKLLLASPVDRSAIFIAKMLSSLLLTFVLHMILLGSITILFNFSALSTLPAIALTIFLADVGFCAVGTLLGALTISSSGKTFLVPALSIPLLAPLIIVATTATRDIFESGGIDNSMQLLVFLTTYAITFIVAGIAAFPMVVCE